MVVNTRQSIHLDVEGEPVYGELVVPEDPAGLVVFAAGTSGTRYATLERRLTDALHRLGIGSVVMDLVSHRESADRATRSDVDLLTRRFAAQVDWLTDQEVTADLDLAVCGVDTGAAAAVEYLSSQSTDVAGLAVLNGRLDLVASSVPRLNHPILFFLEGTHPHLETSYRTAYDRAGVPDRRKHFLHVTNQDALSIVARWVESRLQKPSEPAPRAH
ncbi:MULTISPECIES: hypothetical protein [Salinibaculum]|uniref:hypothetical protein n=1 Tax=Salinibaculum TaxID=2732368 RepID=UPI0030D3C640